jgi:hypothetical protein
MKKLLGIVVLGLLLSGNAYALDSNLTRAEFDRYINEMNPAYKAFVNKYSAKEHCVLVRAT